MKQREIQDRNGVTWTCVQAITGGNKAAAGRAEEQLLHENGKVAVVCTPSGGEKSVHVDLPVQWHEQLSDDMMLTAITAARRAH